MTERFYTGWLPDIPDHRDHAADNSQNVKVLLKSAGVKSLDKVNLPVLCDLRPTFSPIENQGQLGSCTQNAAAGLVEYFERKVYGRYINHSRLFGYWTTRKLMGLTGDSGASLRDTMKAMALFGLPPENHWRYVPADFDKEPTAFVYALAQNFQAAEYYRLDTPGTSPADLLMRIKANLSAGLPSMFGFSVYSSIEQANTTGGDIPFPAFSDRLEGGHAICVAGFDDTREIRNTIDGSLTIGAFLIRNSWGIGWGTRGYGWLPYKYVESGLALDWWSLVRSEWVDLGVFN